MTRKRSAAGKKRKSDSQIQDIEPFIDDVRAEPLSARLLEHLESRLLLDSFTDTDIGSPGVAGSASFDGAVYAVNGGGADIGSTSDQFNFNSENFTGDGTFIARVTSVTNTDPSSKAGIMVRDGTGATDHFFGLFVTPSSSIVAEWRSGVSAAAVSATTPVFGSQVWLKITRSGNVFGAYYSTDGAYWAAVSTPQTVAVNSAAQAGMAVTARNNAALATATFSDVNSSWINQDLGGDIGSTIPAGAASLSGGTFHLSGSGSSITTDFDQTNFTWQVLSGDGTLMGQIGSVLGSNYFARAGLMIRSSLDPSDVSAAIAVAAHGDVQFISRDAADDIAAIASAGVGPRWLKLVRSGGTVTAFYSAQGTIWKQLGTPLAVASGPVYAGLMINSSDATSLASATMNNFSITGVASSAAPVFDGTITFPSSPVTGTSTPLSLAAVDPLGEPNVTYSWSLVNKPLNAATPTFSVNNSNAAKNTAVTFSKAGSYQFQVTMTDTAGLISTAIIPITVAQTFTSNLAITPTTTIVSHSNTLQFNLTATDQFGAAITNPSLASWSVLGGGVGGSISAAGVYTTPATGQGSDTIQASGGSLTATATLNVSNIQGYWHVQADGSDSSGNARTLTLQNSPTFSAGQIGNALTLNGTSQYANTAGPALNTTLPFSVAAWVKLSSITAGTTYTAVSQDATNVSAFALQYRGATNQFSFTLFGSDSTGATPSTAQWTTAPIAGTYYLLVGVYTGTQIKLYVNGSPVATTSFSAAIASSGNTIIGAGLSSTRTNFWNGQVDEPELWSLALTDTQVSSMFTGSTSTPQAFYHLTSDGTDSSGNALTMTVNNGGIFSAGNIGTHGSLTGTNTLGNALTLASTGNQLAQTSANIVNTTQPFTVAAWIKLNSGFATGGYYTAVSQDATNVSGFYLQKRGDTNRFSFTMLSADSNVTFTTFTASLSTLTPVAGTWYFLVGVYTGTQLQLYVYTTAGQSGSTATTSFSAPFASNGNLIVGGGRFGAGGHTDYFPGQIDEVQTFNTALTATQVGTLFSSNSVGTPTGLWHMTDATDSSGNAHSLTVQNPNVALFTAGQVGNALTLNGSNQDAERPSIILPTTSPFTVAAWVKLTSTPLGTPYTAISEDGVNISSFVLGRRGDANGRLMFTMYSTDSSNATAAVAEWTTAPIAGTYYYLVGEYTGTQIKLYVNGTLVATTSFSSAFAATGSTVLGAGRTVAGSRANYWNGQIDEVELFTSALTDSQVATLFSSANSGNLVGVFHLDSSNADDSGYNHPLTLSNGPAYISGKVGNALVFNGVNQFAATSTAVVTTSQPFTVSAWAMWNGGGYYQDLVTQDGTGESAFFLQINGGTGRFSFVLVNSDTATNGGTVIQGGSVPTPNIWYNVTGVFTGTQGILYINGTQAAIATASVFNATGGLIIGAGKFGNGRTDFFGGAVDEVQVFSRALSAAEVAALAGSPGPPLANAPVIDDAGPAGDTEPAAPTALDSATLAALNSISTALAALQVTQDSSAPAAVFATPSSAPLAAAPAVIASNITRRPASHSPYLNFQTQGGLTFWTDQLFAGGFSSARSAASNFVIDLDTGISTSHRAVQGNFLPASSRIASIALRRGHAG